MTKDEVRNRYLALVAQITDTVGLADLTTFELINLVELLIPARRRWLAECSATSGPMPARRKMHVVKGG